MNRQDEQINLSKCLIDGKKICISQNIFVNINEYCRKNHTSKAKISKECKLIHIHIFLKKKILIGSTFWIKIYQNFR